MKTKRLFTIFILLLFAAAAIAEEDKGSAKPEKKYVPPKTLFDQANTSFSGYLGVFTRYSKIGEADGCLVGGKIGVIINDNFVIGGSGMGLTYPTDREKLSGSDYSGILKKTGFGYGGFMMEYYINPKDLVVFSFGTMVGAGGLGFYENSEDEENDHGTTDKFFVVEPEVNVLMNITRFCRVGVGASYRYVSGINTDEFSDSDFRGPSVFAVAQFGWF